jgi:hypothetical protein
MSFEFNKFMLRRLFIVVCFILLCLPVSAQFTYGTTGLLHMPTADMQKDKTFLAGGSYLNKHAMPYYWYYQTYNYYINITFFPWLEVAYTCNVFNEWVKRGKYNVHMINQDRNFSGRLRLWKEGWWKDWTPQIVIGANDVLHGSAEGGDIGAVESGGNTFFQRYYIAATKHLSWHGEWGVHVAYVYSKRIGHKFNGPAIGVDYRFALPETSKLNKVVNKVKLMAEYDSKYVNVGARYAFWKDYINVVAELRECKYPSVGVYFKVHLK